MQKGRQKVMALAFSWSNFRSFRAIFRKKLGHFPTYPFNNTDLPLVTKCWTAYLFRGIHTERIVYEKGCVSLGTIGDQGLCQVWCARRGGPRTKNNFLFWHGAIQGPWTPLVRFFWNYRGSRTLSGVSRSALVAEVSVHGQKQLTQTFIVHLCTS